MEKDKNEGNVVNDSCDTVIMDSVHEVHDTNLKSSIESYGGSVESQVDLAPNNVGLKPEIANKVDEIHDEEEDIDSCDMDSGVNDIVEDGNNIDMSESEPATMTNNDSVKANLPPLDSTSLSVIANYGSDSYDSDDGSVDNKVECLASATTNTTATPVEPPAAMEFQTEYRTIQPSSDDSESDSSKSSDEESSSTSSSESSDEGEGDAKNKAKASSPAPEEDENDEHFVKKLPRTKGEITLDDLPPIEDLQISVPEDACLEMGFISSIVDQQVIVQAKQNFAPLNLETILFLEKGQRPLGAIFDVFGQVTEPFYSVRFNSSDHVKERNIVPGMPVFCAPHSEHTNYVFVEELLKVKGTDSSWEHNNEPPPSCVDYSDDETEMKLTRASRSSQNQSEAFDVDEPPRKRVNSFERRMNERNLRKSALPPEPRHTFAGNLVRGTANIRVKRSRNVAPNGFAGQQLQQQQQQQQQQRAATRPAVGPVFPSPTPSTQQAISYQSRPTQHGWDGVSFTGEQHQPMACGPVPVTTPQPIMRPFSQGRSFSQGRGYGFGPIPSPMPFVPLSNVQGLGGGPRQQDPSVRYHSGIPTHSNTQQGAMHGLAMTYTMGSPMQPNTNSQQMIYPSGFMQNSQRTPFPVLLRPATFQGGPPRYDTNAFAQSMPFGSPSPAFPPCYPSGPPGQAYNPMFSGVPMFNPGFPPPQLPPRANMYPIGPRPLPRGGV